ncbi:ftsK/SpoIIIE family protein [Orientia tsutsugamushi str. UT76]|nr:ftsK/SpoIIIE family protein [Orientia tsutsugamushi str. UT76]
MESDLSSQGMLLAGIRGQIMYWSPFGGALLPALNKHGVAPNENFNLCIAGVPGSGKSVFMQELMLSVLGVGGKVFVKVDVVPVIVIYDEKRGLTRN